MMMTMMMMVVMVGVMMVLAVFVCRVSVRGLMAWAEDSNACPLPEARVRVWGLGFKHNTEFLNIHPSIPEL